MRITNIEGFNLSSPLERPFGWSNGWISARVVGLLKIETDEGITGWGEGYVGARGDFVKQLFGDLLIGADPLNRNALWQGMFDRVYNGNNAGGFGGSAISAVDIALWDIAGKAAGASVSDLLGGRIRDKVAVYATGLYYTEGEFPTRLLDEATMYVELGFKGMKTKIGGLPIAEDVRRVAAIRGVIGDDIRLMVDANQAYPASTAIRIGNQLAELDITWFEEPVNAKDVDAYLQVTGSRSHACRGRREPPHALRVQGFFCQKSIRYSSARCGQRRRHNGDAKHRHDCQLLWYPRQPACVGFPCDDCRQPPPRIYDTAMPARIRTAPL